MAAGTAALVYSINKLRDKKYQPYQDKAYDIALRNKSILTKSTITLAALFLVLSVHYFYGDIYSIQPAGELSFSSKFFTGIAMAAGTAALVYSINKLRDTKPRSDDKHLALI
jgi:hypothetical protein